MVIVVIIISDRRATTHRTQGIFPSKQTTAFSQNRKHLILEAENFSWKPLSVNRKRNQLCKNAFSKESRFKIDFEVTEVK